MTTDKHGDLIPRHDLVPSDDLVLWRQLVPWLMEHGGPAIRWRTATEVAPNPEAYDLDALRADLLASGLASTWLDRLMPPDIHSSKDTAFENAIDWLIPIWSRMDGSPCRRSTT